MADTKIEYKNALNRFRVNLTRTINNKVNKVGNDYAESLANYAKARAVSHIVLSEYKPTTGSLQAIEDLTKRIIVKKVPTKDGLYKHIVAVDNISGSDDFALFLEYGTGYRGAKHSGETGRQDWEYITNPEHDPAFYFKYDESKFLVESDNHPIIRPDKLVLKSPHDTHTVTRRLKSGKIISYQRKTKRRKTHNDYGEITEDGMFVRYPQKPNYKWVRSIGIKPVRYMYKASQDIKELLSHTKKLSVDKVFDIYGLKHK